MNTVVDRTCTEVTDGTSERGTPRPLSEFRAVPSYVLLGDPGSGKTTAFRSECAAAGDRAHLVTARDFVTFHPDDHPEWRGKTLFIDGLDEVRAGQADVRTPFDRIRRHLDALGRPEFRLSCRSSDWLGVNDRVRLEAVSPTGKVTVLRLDPLDDEAVSRILTGRPGLGDPRAFIGEARESGVYGLLSNPQSLEMLIGLVAQGGEWPKGRRETFERACLQMVTEHNLEHRIGGQVPGPEQLLDQAGRLCAIQLISGASGVLSGQLEPDEEYLDPDQCCYPDGTTPRPALSTRLFTVDDRAIARPIHRHIGEFIAARHLSGLIAGGLPVRRVISQITGQDGIVVTEMRGLSAWLAAVCRAARRDLIDRDPTGVGLYGDVDDFSPQEKLALVESLGENVSRLDSHLDAVPAFTGLAVPQVVPAITAILEDSDRSSRRQSYVAFLLLVLALGQRLEGLSDTLTDIVRDRTRRQDVRRSALEAFIRNSADGCSGIRTIREILAHIHSGKIPDADNELVGTILTHMYPGELAASEVWDYLYERGERNYMGAYFLFWREYLVEQTPDDYLGELLDGLKERLPGLRPSLRRHTLEGLPLELLRRGLHAWGDEMKPEDLYEWLRMGSGLWRRSSRDQAYLQIRSWLQRRPSVQKAVIAEGLARCSDSGQFEADAFDVYECLYGSELPPDFGLWSADRAAALADGSPQVAEHLLHMAVRELRTRAGRGGLSVELLRTRTAGNAALRTKLDQLLSPPPTASHRRDDRHERDFAEDQRHQEAKWLHFVASQERALRENRAPPRLLFELAESYLGGVNRQGEGPGAGAVEELLKGDAALASAAMEGLRGTVCRPDVPDVAQILKLRDENRIHYLSLPLLVGMAELEMSSSTGLLRLDDSLVRIALAFHRCTPHVGARPAWYRRLLTDRPEMVADIQFQFTVSRYKGHEDHVNGLWDLAHDEDHAQVARLVSLRLLREFPTRCRVGQAESLDSLLWAAMRHADRSSLEELIAVKLSRKSMNDAQRARWLAAGLFTSPQKYLESVERFTLQSERRIRHLASLFHTRLPINLQVSAKRLLIRLIGSSFGPEQMYANGWVTPAEQGSLLVRKLIDGLSGSTDPDASEALDDLISETGLSRWTELLSRARDSQRVVHRDAHYRHPSAGAVCRMLNGSTPANPGDLAAVVLDHLDGIGRTIRSDNTEDWRQYWSGDPPKHPGRPKREEHCRDALLSDLRKLLPDGIDAEPEAQYANDRRADIRVRHTSGFHVPVEAKKNNHRDLWSAMRGQLMESYTSSPETGGFGIYLVFWFGPELTMMPPEGNRPETAEELKQRLEDLLTPDQARKISVRVIDVSPG